MGETVSFCSPDLNRPFDLCPCVFAEQVQRFALNLTRMISQLAASDQNSFLALKQGLTSGRFPNPRVGNEPLSTVGSSSLLFCCRVFGVSQLWCLCLCSTFGLHSPTTLSPCAVSQVKSWSQGLVTAKGASIGPDLKLVEAYKKTLSFG